MNKGYSLSVLLIAFFLVILVPPIQAAPSPTYAWHTFYESGTNDDDNAIVRDESGNVYVTGTSFGSWDGPAGQTPLHAHSGGYDIFVLKLDNSGAYQWHTFYGSINPDQSSGIATDGSGNVYVTGYSTATWDGPAGESPLHPYSANADIFILKLDGSGAYQWHAFYGSNEWDDGSGIATDAIGNVYVTGYSQATWDGPTGQSPLHAHTGSGYTDIFVLKLDSSGAYQWHTFYGSSSWDEGYAITIDAGGTVYVTGYSQVTWDGPTGQSPLHTHTGNYDIFVLRLDSSGAYQWHTFHGSNSLEDAYAIATDVSGNLYITGESSKTWNGPTGQSPLHAHGGFYDTFVLKLNSSGAYQWHTFYGSSSFDSGYAIATDGTGNLYVTGHSAQTWNGPTGQSPLHAHSGPSSFDIFVLKLDSSGSYRWHTFYGSSDYDLGYGIAADASGNVYVTGHSAQTWNGPAGQNPLHAYSLGDNIFVLKLAVPVADLVETAVSDPPSTSMARSSFSVTDTVKNEGGGSAGASITSYYLSLDTIRGGGDILLTGGRLVPSLGINETNDGIRTVTIPSIAAAGSYFLLACADSTNLVDESNENNNCIASASKVSVGPVVSVTATDSTATEGGDTGTFRITRTEATTSDLIVRFAMSGSTRNKLDYNTITSPVTIPAGAASVDITLIPIDDSIYEGDELAVLTLSVNAAYQIGSPSSATITIQDNDPRPSFSVISPNGGETWAAGSIQTIQWTYGGNPGSLVRIQLFKGGALNRTIASTSVGSGGSGSYNWSIPPTQVAGTDYQIKVTSTTNAAYTDTSDGNFTIVGPPPPTISVTSPNGGESLPSGTTQTIRWDYTGNLGAYLKIELLKGGVLNKVITSLARTSARSFNWMPPVTLTPGADYSIRITSRTNLSWTDTSDSNFTIAAPTVTLTSPNGGENWAPGTIQTISWTFTGGPGTYLKIELLKGGILNRTLTSLALTSRGSFSWKIPATQVPGADYSIRVTSRIISSCTDTSDLDSTIGP